MISFLIFFYIGERPVANISCVFRTKPQIKQHTMYGKRCLIATGKPLWRFVGATVHLHIFKPVKDRLINVQVASHSPYMTFSMVNDI